MGRSPSTENLARSYPSFVADVTLHLQQLVAGWHRTERNQPLTDLYTECFNAAGSVGCHLLSIKLLSVIDLNETHLQVTLSGLNGKARGTRLRFRVRPVGRFDSVFIPSGPVRETPDMSKIRRLDAENSKRRKEVATRRKSIGQIIELSPESLAVSPWISNVMKHLSNQDNCMFGVHSAICFV